MNIAHLYYFSEIVKYRSINKAANNLFMTPSTLLSALNSLENELGYKLVNRSRQGVSPTIEGEAFFNDIQLILTMQERWKNVTHIDNRTKIQLPLGAIPAIYHSVLPQIIGDFASLYPHISIITREADILLLDKQLIDGDIRIALRSCTKFEHENLKIFTHNLGLTFSSVYSDTCSVILNASHPLAASESLHPKTLTNYPSVALSHPSALRFAFSKLYDTKVTLYLNNISYILQFLRTHPKYYSFLYNIVSKGIYFSDHTLVSVPLRDDSLPLHIVLIHPQPENMTQEEKVLVNFLESFFKDL